MDGLTGSRHTYAAYVCARGTLPRDGSRWRPAGTNGDGISTGARTILQRVVGGALVVLLVTTILFFVSRVISDPARRMLEMGATEDRRAAVTADLGLDRPLLDQYSEFVARMARLDLGESLWQHRPALGIVLEQLPASLALVAVSTVVSVVVFVPLGVLAALHAGRRLDRVVSAVSLAGLSTPQFWFGQMLILVFAVQLGWLPSFGTGSPAHMALPVATLAVVSGGRLLHVTRAAVVEQLGADYVRTAKAKGFGSGHIVRHHVLRNTLVPVLTIAAWDVADSLAGNVVIVEAVFARPGIGTTLLDAINRQDLVLVEAAVFSIAIVVVTTHHVADALARRVDPRIETSS